MRALELLRVVRRRRQMLVEVVQGAIVAVAEVTFICMTVPGGGSGHVCRARLDSGASDAPVDGNGGDDVHGMDGRCDLVAIDARVAASLLNVLGDGRRHLEETWAHRALHVRGLVDTRGVVLEKNFESLKERSQKDHSPEQARSGC